MAHIYLNHYFSPQFCDLKAIKIFRVCYFFVSFFFWWWTSYWKPFLWCCRFSLNVAKVSLVPCGGCLRLVRSSILCLPSTLLLHVFNQQQKKAIFWPVCQRCPPADATTAMAHAFPSPMQVPDKKPVNQEDGASLTFALWRLNHPPPFFYSFSSAIVHFLFFFFCLEEKVPLWLIFSHLIFFCFNEAYLIWAFVFLYSASSPRKSSWSQTVLSLYVPIWRLILKTSLRERKTAKPFFVKSS